MQAYLSTPSGRGRRAEEAQGAAEMPTLDPRQHTAALVALVLGAVAIVGLGTGVLIGWAGGGGLPESQTSVQATSSTATSGPPARAATTTSCRPPGRGTRDLGYFVGAHEEPDGIHATFDRALLYVGADARHEARVYGLQDQVHHGTLLVNQNPKLRDLVLAPRVRICGLQQLASRDRATPVSQQQLLTAVASRGSTILLDLTYDGRGRVVFVEEKDLP
jgi:hypothetical protein